MPQVADAVAALDPAHVAAALREGREIGISLDGHDHTLGPSDLQLAMRPLDGYQLEREGSHAVALDLALDDELRREGLAREIVHAVQSARRSAGLAVEDRIALALGGDEELLAAARAYEDYVRGETLARSLSLRGRRQRVERDHRRARAADRARAGLAHSRRPGGSSGFAVPSTAHPRRPMA